MASHGNVVGALEHSEAIVPQLARRSGETAEERTVRIDGWIANRIPDIRFLIDHVLDTPVLGPNVVIDERRVGLAGMSFGGWTVLAAAEQDARVRSIVALAPAGSTIRMPGMIPAEIQFARGTGAPTLYLVAADDASLPLRGMEELYARAPVPKRMIVRERADHMPFMDDTETRHEGTRGATFEGELAWLPGAMLPIAELISGEQAHLVARGLACAHFDATLRERADAIAFLSHDLEAVLARRGIAVSAR